MGAKNTMRRVPPSISRPHGAAGLLGRGQVFSDQIYFFQVLKGCPSSGWSAIVLARISPVRPRLGTSSEWVWWALTELGRLRCTKKEMNVRRGSGNTNASPQACKRLCGQTASTTFEA